MATRLRLESADGQAAPLISRGSARFRVSGQLSSSARSVPANIAEGFGRYRPTEIARFLEIARGSLDETETHLRCGVAEGYFSQESVAPLIVPVAMPLSDLRLA